MKKLLLLLSLIITTLLFGAGAAAGELEGNPEELSEEDQLSQDYRADGIFIQGQRQAALWITNHWDVRRLETWDKDGEREIQGGDAPELDEPIDYDDHTHCYVTASEWDRFDNQIGYIKFPVNQDIPGTADEWPLETEGSLPYYGNSKPGNYFFEPGAGRTAKGIVNDLQDHKDRGRGFDTPDKFRYRSGVGGDWFEPGMKPKGELICGKTPGTDQAQWQICTQDAEGETATYNEGEWQQYECGKNEQKWKEKSYIKMTGITVNEEEPLEPGKDITVTVDFDYSGSTPHEERITLNSENLEGQNYKDFDINSEGSGSIDFLDVTISEDAETIIEIEAESENDEKSKYFSLNEEDDGNTAVDQLNVYGKDGDGNPEDKRADPGADVVLNPRDITVGYDLDGPNTEYGYQIRLKDGEDFVTDKCNPSVANNGIDVKQFEDTLGTTHIVDVSEDFSGSITVENNCNGEFEITTYGDDGEGSNGDEGDGSETLDKVKVYGKGSSSTEIETDEGVAELRPGSVLVSMYSRTEGYTYGEYNSEGNPLGSSCNVEVVEGDGSISQKVFGAEFLNINSGSEWTIGFPGCAGEVGEVTIRNPEGDDSDNGDEDDGEGSNGDEGDGSGGSGGSGVTLAQSWTDIPNNGDINPEAVNLNGCGAVVVRSDSAVTFFDSDTTDSDVEKSINDISGQEVWAGNECSVNWNN